MDAFRGHRRGRPCTRLAHGLFLPGPDPTSVEVLRGWQLVLPPTAAFTSLTSALLRGWWQPGPVDHPVFAAMSTADPRPRRAGLHVCRHPDPPAHQWWEGLRVATAAETVLAAARDLGLLDVVLLGDAALHSRQCTLVDLAKAARPRRRGAPLLRRALPLLDARSESPWESVLRVLHHVAAVPVTPQVEIRDGAGRVVARADLLVDGTRRLHEYDGDTHRTVAGHASDLARDRSLAALGHSRFGYTSRDLLVGYAAVFDDLDRLLGRPRDARRVQEWRTLLDASLFSPRGRARAYDRWDRG